MIRTLLYTVLALASTVNTQQQQQTQLVYEQHYADQQQQQQQQPYYAPQQQQAVAQQYQQQQFVQPQQQFAQPQQHFAQPQQQFAQPQQGIQMQGGYYQAQPQQQQQAYHQAQQQHQQQPNFHQAQQPMIQQGFMAQGPQGGQQQMYPVVPGQPLPPGAIPVQMSASQFASRRGPLQNMIKGAAQYFPGGGGGGKKRRGGPPVRMMDMNRLPKPPKYPLYDMPDMGMATPPPPPLMHPMSAMASQMFSTYIQPAGGTKRGGRPPPRGKTHRRPLPPPHMKKRPVSGPRKNRPQHPPPRPGRRPNPLHGNHGSNPHAGYEHTMASSLDPQVQSNSPPLGRPLNYDEYMQRPSHSFTDDPWNFDPFAANYNSGMNTYAMKYNYDPLGMNALDKSQTHLDPDSLSYPGDYHTLQSEQGPSGGKTSQVGGWDKAPDTYRPSEGKGSQAGTGWEKTDQYRTPEHKGSTGGGWDKTPDPYRTGATTELLPPPIKEPKPSRRPSHKPSHKSSSSTPLNSFNLYDQAPDSSVVKAESLNPNPLKLLADANPGIEFTLESSAGGGDSYGSSSSSYSSQYKDYPEWNSYPQNAQEVYEGQDAQAQGSTRQDYGTGDYPPNPNYENGAVDPSTKLHQYQLAQDYVPRDRPVSDLSDSYSPHGGELSTGLTPPSETAAMFKRQGDQTRSRRQETSPPMVEIDGLSLFRDILKNEKAHGTRSQLYKVLSN